jgi:hypothetical protein
MGKFASNDVIDAALLQVQTSTHIAALDGQPADFAAAGSWRSARKAA